MRFDHERIPERVVHARGAGAFGHFKLYESAADVTHAGVLTDTSRTTPVFVRFSTVLGSRGSADTVRDVRGFAVRNLESSPIDQSANARSRSNSTPRKVTGIL